jgi:hypothetical protein
MVRAWESDGEALDRWMALHDVGHAFTGVGLDLDTPGNSRQLNLPFLARRPNGVPWLGGSGVASASVPHAAHLLPVYATAQRVEGLPIPVSRL